MGFKYDIFDYNTNVFNNLRLFEKTVGAGVEKSSCK